ncbi:ATP synthase subunit b [bacterium HR35]|nr:ATP synthase subunit b [bacterium HR35]
MEKLFEAFGIDLKILISQAINFFIVFFVIYKFFVKPLNQVIEERKRKIEEGLKLRKEAEKLLKKIKLIRKKNQEKIFEEKRQAKEEIENFRKEKIAEILKETEELRNKMMMEIEEERKRKREEFYQQLERETPQIMLNLAKKIFGKEELNEKFIINSLKNDR